MVAVRVANKPATGRQRLFLVLHHTTSTALVATYLLTTLALYLLLLLH